MSGINIKSEKDLLSFLKILAEEASSKSLREYDESYNEKYRSDTKRYGNLSEQEDVEETPDDSEVEDNQENEDESEIPMEDESEIDDVPIPSYQSVKNAINTIRAGKSLKIDDIDQNLSAYYERLSEEERLVLQTYLNSVSSILSMTKKGDEAQDPGDPPVSINMTTADKEADEEAEEEVEGEEAEEEVEGEEDTSPPIQVSENKNYRLDNDFRKKIRQLLEQ